MTSGFDLQWRTSNVGVLSVDARGAVRGTGAGSAWLVASAGGARDSVLVAVGAVVAAVVGAVDIAESGFTLEVGASRTLSASASAASGTRIERDIAWTSSNTAAVIVDARTGRVTARGAGAAQVTASADGFSDAITVNVSEPAPALPAADVATAAVAAYVDLLAGGDEDAVRRYWGAADDDGLDEIVDLMGERQFTATLTTVGDPTEQASGACARASAA